MAVEFFCFPFIRCLALCPVLSLLRYVSVSHSRSFNSPLPGYIVQGMSHSPFSGCTRMEDAQCGAKILTQSDPFRPADALQTPSRLLKLLAVFLLLWQTSWRVLGSLKEVREGGVGGEEVTRIFLMRHFLRPSGRKRDFSN